MARPKGAPKTPGSGRQKGTPNKITADLKHAILEAAEAAGGEGGTVGYLTTLAKDNPNAFAGLLGKVLPMTVAGEPDKPIEFRVERVFVEPPKRTPAD